MTHLSFVTHFATATDFQMEMVAFSNYNLKNVLRNGMPLTDHVMDEKILYDRMPSNFMEKQKS